LGGLDIDQNIVELCAKEFLKETGIDVKDNPRAIRRLLTEAGKAKKILSKAFSVEMVVDALADGEDFSFDLTREKFEEINTAIFEKIELIILRCLKESEIEPKDFTEIILVGASCRIPRMQAIVQKIFKDKKIDQTLHPDLAIAQGAAKQAALCSIGFNDVPNSGVMIDIAPGSFGFKNNEGKFCEVFPKDTSIPVAVPFTLKSSSNFGSMPSLELQFEDTSGKRRKISTFDLKPFKSYLKGDDLTLILEVSDK